MEIEKGKTAKYLREKLGGVPELAKETLKEYTARKKRILEAFSEEDAEYTVKQLAEKLGVPADEAMYDMMSLVKFGFLKVGEIDDMDEYFTYKLNK